MKPPKEKGHMGGTPPPDLEQFKDAICSVNCGCKTQEDCCGDAALKLVEKIEAMRRINEIRESNGYPVFKTLKQYLEWRETEVEYDN